MLKSWFIDVFGGGAFEGVYDMLNVTLLGEGKYANASNFTSEIYSSVMVPIALSLLVIYFVCNLVEKSTNEQFTYEQLFLQFAKLIVAVFLIDKGYDLMMEFQKVGLGFLKAFSNKAAALGLSVGGGGGEAYINNSPELQLLYEQYTNATWPDAPKFFEALECIISDGFTLLVAFLATLLIKGCVSVIMFMRILEVYVRTMFAPIALSDVFHNGLNSTGFRFLKNYLAVSLQIVVIYGCVLLNSVIAGDILSNSAGLIAHNTFIFKYVGLSAATVGLLFKSQSLIKEFVGTN